MSRLTRPTAPEASANQTLPSGPVTIPLGWGSEITVVGMGIGRGWGHLQDWPSTVTISDPPVEFSVNQRLPSGPAVILLGGR